MGCELHFGSENLRASLSEAKKFIEIENFDQKKKCT